MLTCARALVNRSPSRLGLGQLPCGFRYALVSSAVEGFFRRSGIAQFSPLQRQVWPRLDNTARCVATSITQAHKSIEQEDTIVLAETGSGKTICYSAPIVEAVYEKRHGPRPAPTAVVLIPTSELCSQVASHFRSISPQLVVYAMLGGEVPAEADILVGTPAAVRQVCTEEIGLPTSNS